MFRVALFSAVTMFCFTMVVAAELTVDRNDAGSTAKTSVMPLPCHPITLLSPSHGPT